MSRLIPSAGFIYLASPYSHKDPFIREMRYLWVMKEMGAMLKTGLYVYSPIVHCHELVKVCDLPRDAAFWEKYNFTMLAAAEYLYLLVIPGTRESIGCAAEIKQAQSCNIPIIEFEPKEQFP